MGERTLATAEDTGRAWQVAHAALSRLARERAAADADEGRWLLAALRSAVHVHLGFGTFGAYIERLFGYRPRSTQEKLRVAEALEGLAVLRRSLTEGELSWSAARELTRVAIAETERDWLDLAHGKSPRQLEELIAGKRLGDDPTSPPDASAQRHILRFEIAAETFALFREVLSELRRRSASALADDAALLEMARLVLGGPRDEGRASYQIVLSVCPECGAGRQHAGGALVPIAPEIAGMAHCDGQHVGCVAEPMEVHHRPANDAHVAAQVDTPDAHHHREKRGTPPRNNRSHATSRAKQRIPPALRRAVLLRDQRRCRVPGCKNATFLDLHHLPLRSEGGRNTAENLLTLCGAHHRAAHRGELIIDGSEAAADAFRHADGGDYGRPVNPHELEVQTKVFAALRGLGFREIETRAVLTKLRQERELRGVAPERLLRGALVRMRPTRRS